MSGDVSEWMSPRKRFISAVLGGRVDRPAAGSATSVATIEQMEQTGCFFPEAHYIPEKIAGLASAAYEVIGFDCIMPYFSVWLDAAALGCQVNWGDKYRMPDGVSREGLGVTDPNQFRIPEDFLYKPTTSALLEAIEILRGRYPNVAIVGKVMGPWTLCLHILGVKRTLIWSKIRKDTLKEWIKLLKEVSIEFAKAQVKAGADVICWPDHATGDLVSAEAYREFLLEIHREAVRRVGAPLILHICGDTVDRLPYICETGFDCFHFDSKCGDPLRVRAIAGSRISLMGNINNPQTLLYGKPEDVMREAKHALEAGVDIVGPECAIPTRVANENLKAIVKVAKQFRRDKS